jgi:hypothetical protein
MAKTVNLVLLLGNGILIQTLVFVRLQKLFGMPPLQFVNVQLDYLDQIVSLVQLLGIGILRATRVFVMLHSYGMVQIVVVLSLTSHIKVAVLNALMDIIGWTTNANNAIAHL